VRFAASVATVLVAISFSGNAAAMDIPEPTVQTIWQKACVKFRKPGFKSVCATRAEVRKRDDDSLVAAVGIIEPEGDAKKILRFTVPLGMQLAYGTRLVFSNGDIRQGPYVLCAALGCFADHEATQQILVRMKRGKGMVVQAIDRKGQPFNVSLSLAGFRAAYDDPGDRDRRGRTGVSKLPA
jgi:invasion protein IalB